MSNYCQACGPHSVFTLWLTPALRPSLYFPAWWISRYSKVKVSLEKQCSQFLKCFSWFIFWSVTEFLVNFLIYLTITPALQALFEWISVGKICAKSF